LIDELILVAVLEAPIVYKFYVLTFETERKKITVGAQLKQ